MSVIDDEKDLTLTPDSVVSGLVDDTTGLSEELKAKVEAYKLNVSADSADVAAIIEMYKEREIQNKANKQSIAIAEKAEEPPKSWVEERLENQKNSAKVFNALDIELTGNQTAAATKNAYSEIDYDYTYEGETFLGIDALNPDDNIQVNEANIEKWLHEGEKGTDEHFDSYIDKEIQRQLAAERQAELLEKGYLTKSNIYSEEDLQELRNAYRAEYKQSIIYKRNEDAEETAFQAVFQGRIAEQKEVEKNILIKPEWYNPTDLTAKNVAFTNLFNDTKEKVVTELQTEEPDLHALYTAQSDLEDLDPTDSAAYNKKREEVLALRNALGFGGFLRAPDGVPLEGVTEEMATEATEASQSAFNELQYIYDLDNPETLHTLKNKWLKVNLLKNQLQEQYENYWKNSMESSEEASDSGAPVIWGVDKGKSDEFDAIRSALYRTGIRADALNHFYLLNHRFLESREANESEAIQHYGAGFAQGLGIGSIEAAMIFGTNELKDQAALDIMGELGINATEEEVGATGISLSEEVGGFMGDISSLVLKLYVAKGIINPMLIGGGEAAGAYVNAAKILKKAPKAKKWVEGIAANGLLGNFYRARVVGGVGGGFVEGVSTAQKAQVILMEGLFEELAFRSVGGETGHGFGFGIGHRLPLSILGKWKPKAAFGELFKHNVLGNLGRATTATASMEMASVMGGAWEMLKYDDTFNEKFNELYPDLGSEDSWGRRVLFNLAMNSLLGVSQSYNPHSIGNILKRRKTYDPKTGEYGISGAQMMKDQWTLDFTHRKSELIEAINHFKAPPYEINNPIAKALTERLVRLHKFELTTENNVWNRVIIDKEAFDNPDGESTLGVVTSARHSLLVNMLSTVNNKGLAWQKKLSAFMKEYNLISAQLHGGKPVSVSDLLNKVENENLGAKEFLEVLLKEQGLAELEHARYLKNRKRPIIRETIFANGIHHRVTANKEGKEIKQHFGRYNAEGKWKTLAKHEVESLRAADVKVGEKLFNHEVEVSASGKRSAADKGNFTGETLNLIEGSTNIGEQLKLAEQAKADGANNSKLIKGLKMAKRLINILPESISNRIALHSTPGTLNRVIIQRTSEMRQEAIVKFNTGEITAEEYMVAIAKANEFAFNASKNPVVMGSKGTIHLDLTAGSNITKASLGAVMVHELMHPLLSSIEKMHPEQYAKLEKQAQSDPKFRQKLKWARKQYGNSSRDLTPTQAKEIERTVLNETLAEWLAQDVNKKALSTRVDKRITRPLSVAFEKMFKNPALDWLQHNGMDMRTLKLEDLSDASVISAKLTRAIRNNVRLNFDESIGLEHYEANSSENHFNLISEHKIIEILSKKDKLTEQETEKLDNMMYARKLRDDGRSPKEIFAKTGVFENRNGLLMDFAGPAMLNSENLTSLATSINSIAKDYIAGKGVEGYSISCDLSEIMEGPFSLYYPALNKAKVTIKFGKTAQGAAVGEGLIVEVPIELLSDFSKAFDRSPREAMDLLGKGNKERDSPYAGLLDSDLIEAPSSTGFENIIVHEIQHVIGNKETGVGWGTGGNLRTNRHFASLYVDNNTVERVKILEKEMANKNINAKNALEEFTSTENSLPETAIEGKLVDVVEGNYAEGESMSFEESPLADLDVNDIVSNLKFTRTESGEFDGFALYMDTEGELGETVSTVVAFLTTSEGMKDSHRYVVFSYVTPELRQRLGVGKILYESVAKSLGAQGERLVDGNTLSRGAEQLWESFDKRGMTDRMVGDKFEGERTIDSRVHRGTPRSMVDLHNKFKNFDVTTHRMNFEEKADKELWSDFVRYQDYLAELKSDNKALKTSAYKIFEKAAKFEGQLLYAKLFEGIEPDIDVAQTLIEKFRQVISDANKRVIGEKESNTSTDKGVLAMLLLDLTNSIDGRIKDMSPREAQLRLEAIETLLNKFSTYKKLDGEVEANLSVALSTRKWLDLADPKSKGTSTEIGERGTKQIKNSIINKAKPKGFLKTAFENFENGAANVLPDNLMEAANVANIDPSSSNLFLSRDRVKTIADYKTYLDKFSRNNTFISKDGGPHGSGKQYDPDTAEKLRALGNIMRAHETLDADALIKYNDMYSQFRIEILDYKALTTTAEGETLTTPAQDAFEAKNPGADYETHLKQWLSVLRPVDLGKEEYDNNWETSKKAIFEIEDFGRKLFKAKKTEKSKLKARNKAMMLEVLNGDGNRLGRQAFLSRMFGLDKEYSDSKFGSSVSDLVEWGTGNIWSLLDELSINHSTSKSFGSPLSKFVMDIVQEAELQEYSSKYTVLDILNHKMREIHNLGGEVEQTEWSPLSPEGPLSKNEGRILNRLRETQKAYKKEQTIQWKTEDGIGENEVWTPNEIANLYIKYLDTTNEAALSKMGILKKEFSIKERFKDFGSFLSSQEYLETEIKLLGKDFAGLRVRTVEQAQTAINKGYDNKVATINKAIKAGKRTIEIEQKTALDHITDRENETWEYNKANVGKYGKKSKMMTYLSMTSLPNIKFADEKAAFKKDRERVIKKAKDDYEKLMATHSVDLQAAKDMLDKGEKLIMGEAKKAYEADRAGSLILTNKGKAILDQMGPELKQWADYLVSDFFPQYANGELYEGHKNLNSVFTEIYGFPLPVRANYSPTLKEMDAEATDFVLDLMSGDRVSSQISSSHFKKKSNNKQEIAKQDINEMLSRFVQSMEFFKAFQDPANQLNDMFNNAEIKKKIGEDFGKGTHARLNNHLMHIMGKEKSRSSGLRWLQNRRKDWVVGTLAAKPSLAFKQLTSLVAYSADMPSGEWRSGVMALLSPGTEGQENFANLKEAWSTLSELPVMKQRYHRLEFDDAVRQIMSAEYDNIPSHKGAVGKALVSMLMSPVIAGDKTAIIVGGWPVYQYTLKKSLAEGMEPEAAKKEAERAFMSTTRLAQQASSEADKTNAMRNPMANLMTMYKTSPMSYYRHSASAMRNLSASRGNPRENMKQLMIYHFLLPQLFQGVSTGFVLARDKYVMGEDDEFIDAKLKWDSKEASIGNILSGGEGVGDAWLAQIRAGIVGPLNGAFVVGDIFNYAMNYAVEDKEYKYNLSPVESAGTAILSASGSIFDLVGEVMQEEVTMEELIESIMAFDEGSQLLNVADKIGAASTSRGVPYPGMKKFGEGLYNLLHTEPYHYDKAADKKGLYNKMESNKNNNNKR